MPRTVWRLHRLSYPAPDVDGLDVTVAVDTTAPPVVDAIERAAARAGVHLERVAGDDPRFGELLGVNELAGLVVAFKALVARAGGHVEITEAELLDARTLLAQVDVTPAALTIQLVDGVPPDGPRLAAEQAEPLTPADRDEISNGLGELDGGGE